MTVALDTKTSALNLEVWDKFCEGVVREPSRVVHAEALVCDVELLKTHVAQAMSALTSSYESRRTRRLRVFRNNTHDYARSEHLTYDGFSGDDPLAWLEHLGDDGGHCIAVNDLDAWGPGLAEVCAADFVPALAEHLERHWLVLDWYGFISDTEWTPFGLHSDAEPSLLFNLGPGTKTAWIWAPEVLPSLRHGRPTTVSFDELLDDAVAYPLAAGAAIAIPEGHFHVLKSDAPCTLLGAGLYPADYTAELSAFFGNKISDGIADVDNAAINPSALIAKYVEAVGRTPSSSRDTLSRYLRLLRAKTRSLSYSRVPRCSRSGPGPAEIDTQNFVVTRHPIIAAAERVLVVNGGILEVPAPSLDAAALRVWLSQHPRFRGSEFIAAFAPAEAEHARRIAGQLFQHDILRTGEASNG